jgi:hypothetical protein
VAVFLANVGVNSSHAARSPLFEDGTFLFVPIPEAIEWRPPMVRVDDLEAIGTYVPPSWRQRAVHLDPDLISPTPTYGDNCRRAGRAFSLRRAAPGDLIVFLARLHSMDKAAGFYLVGCLEIEDVLADVTTDPGRGWWDCNAHTRRARTTGVWDSFWVFQGTPASRFFGRAIHFRHKDADVLFDNTLRWPSHRSELQTIGSYTRAVRRVDGAGEKWLRTICLS